MGCITCGKSFDSSFFAVVKRKKEEFDNLGTEYYVYRKDKDSVWSVTRKEYFKIIFGKEKPSEYFHISEFKPN
jgi:hypothetical protein